MNENRQLVAIQGNMPEYEKCRSEFVEHFNMFQKLGAANYAALGTWTGLAAPSHETVGIFLAGMALGKASEISERESSNLKVNVWDALVAWTLVENELAAIRPGPEPSCPG